MNTTTSPTMLRTWVCAAITAVLLGSQSHAALVIYEGFDMGGTAGALAGKAGATSIGLDGTWGNQTGIGTITYETAGLTFGSGGTNLLTIGGHASMVTTGGNFTAMSRGIDSTITGTAWGSFLVNRTGQGGTEGDFYELLVNTSATGHDNNAEFVIAAEEFNSANGGLRGKNNPVFPSYNTGTTIADNTTYLVLYKATNLGGSTGTVSLTNWILSADQFATFKAGGLTESELDLALIGTGASDVFQRGSLTYTPGGAYHRLTSADFLMMQLGQGLDGFYDELRISNSSSGGVGGGLDEVTPLPEPSRAMLVLLGVAGMVMRRRRATACSHAVP